MANIQPYIDQIQNATYGEEVRSSIINALELVNADNESYQEIKEAVVDAKDKVEEVAENISDQISTADGLATTLEGDISVGQQVKSELEDSTTTAQQTKGDLDSSITAGTTLRGDLEDLVASGSSIRADVEASAQTATQKAGEASQSASTAVQAKNETVTAKNTAVEASQTAVTKAGEASTSASTATQKAGEASQSASTAVQAKDTAVTKATEAGQSATTAVQAKGEAETARDTAVTSAQSMSASVQQIETNKNDITALKADFLQSLIYDTASGAVATFSDGADSMPCKSVVAQIVPVQSGSGDPSPDNVRPISGWDAVTVKRCGKNLSTTPNWSGHTGVLVDFTNKPLPIGTYIFSALATRDGSISRQSYVIFNYTDNTSSSYGIFAPNTPNRISAVINARKPVKNLYAYSDTDGYIASQNLTLTLTDIQLELGSTATSYEPYTGSTYSVNLPQIVYGGEVDVVSGELVIDRAMVDLGTMDWTAYSSPDRHIFRTVYPNPRPFEGNNALPPLAICSSYYPMGYDPISDNDNGAFSIGYGANRIVVVDHRFSDVTSFGSAVNGVQLCYKIATPITVSLTPHEVRSLLGANTVYADSGDVSVEYPADTKLYISRLTEPDSADMIADANIVSGKYFMVGNDLYLATANIANGGAITPGTNCTKVSLATALNAINS